MSLFFLGVMLFILPLSFDDESVTNTWNEFCNLECLERRFTKKCC